MTEERKVQLGVSVDATDAKQGLNDIKTAAQSMAQSVAQSGAQAGKAVDGIGNGGAASANKVDAATKLMIQSIQRTTAVMEAGSKTSAKYFETLAAQRGVDVNALRPYLDQLDALNAKQKDVGVSAGQTAQALRMIPAQMTDIVTSLASGQQPLTVLIQQGGQLKDQFGGIGPAARAMGTYIAGLVTPLTAAAAGMAAFGAALYYGSEESRRLNSAIVMSGNLLGTTTAQLATAASNVGKVTGSYTAAREVVEALAASGQFAGDQLDAALRTVVVASQATGKSVAEMVATLEKINKEPLKAITELNDRYNFLTVETYKHIKALEDQGDTQKAATLAFNEYADAVENRGKKIKENLGIFQKLAKDIATEWDNAKENFLGIGRERTDEERLLYAQNQLRSMLSTTGANLAPDSRAAKEIQDQIALIRVIQDRIEATNALATAEGEAARARKEAQDQLQTYEKYLGNTARMTDGQRRNKQLEDEEKAFKAAVKGLKEGSDAYQDALRAYNTAVDNINESFNKKGEKKYDDLIKRSQDYLANLKKETETAGLNAEQKKIYDAMWMAGELQKAGVNGQYIAAFLNYAQQEIDATAAIVQAQKEVEESNKRAAEGKREAERVLKSYSDELKKSVDGAVREAEANERLAATYGMTKAQIEALTLAELENEYANRAALGLTLDRVEALEKLIEAKKRSVAALAQVDVMDQAKKLSEQWKRDFDRIEDWIGDAIGRGITQGKDVFKSLIDGLKESFARLVLSPIIKPIAALGASFLNPGTAQAAGSVASAGGDIMQGASLLSAGKTLWEGFSTGLSGSLGGIATGVGNALGISSLSSFGAGMTAVGGNTANAAMLAYAQTTGNVATGASLGASVGAALPWIAGAAAVAAIVAKGLSMKTVGSGILGSISGDDFEGDSYVFKRGGFLRGGSRTETSDLDRSTNAAFSTAIEGMYANFADLGKTVGVGGDLLKNFSYEFRLALADFDDAGKQKEIQRALSTMSDSMAQAFVDSFRTSIDTAQQAASRYFTNTIDGQHSFDGGVVSQARVASPLDPYIDDMVRIFDTFKSSVAGVEGSEGKLSAFVTQLFGLGDSLVENSGYAKMFGESLDFDKLEAAAAKGESVVDTFARLNTVFAATNQVAVYLGKNFDTAFGAIGLASTEARQRLIDVAGGLDALASQTSFFAQNFLTEAEQLKPVADQVSAVFTKFGIAGDTTNDQFANIVKGLDLSTEAGAQMYAQLTAIAPAFLAVANAAESAAAAAKALSDAAHNLDIEYLELVGDTAGATKARRAAALSATDPSLRPQMERNFAQEDNNSVYEKTLELMRLTGRATEAVNVQRQRELMALPEAARGIQQMIWAREDELSAVDTAFATLQRAVDAERKSVTTTYQNAMERVGAQIDIVTSSVSKLTNLSSTLKSTVNSMRLDSQLGMDRAAASAQIQAALAIAKAGGVLPDAFSLQNALSLIAQPNEQLYASFVDFQRNYLKDKNAIADLADLTDSALSIEEKTLKSLEEQKKATEAGYKAEMTRLDGILERAQAQLDALNGINTSVLSVRDALAAFNRATTGVGGGAISPGGGIVGSSPGYTPTGNANNDFLTSIYQQYLGRDVDAQGAAHYGGLLNSGAASMNDVIDSILNSIEFKNINGFAAGGFHAGGLRIVGENGPELELTGPSRIFSASQTADILRGGSDNAEVVSELRALREENVQLRTELGAVMRAVSESSRKTADLMDNVTAGGSAMLVEIDT